MNKGEKKAGPYLSLLLSVAVFALLCYWTKKLGLGTTNFVIVYSGVISVLFIGHTVVRWGLTKRGNDGVALAILVIFWATLPIILTGVATGLRWAGYEGAAETVFRFRYHSVWLAPAAFVGGAFCVVVVWCTLGLVFLAFLGICDLITLLPWFRKHRPPKK